MTEARNAGVAINGYGVIGKRVAEAIQLQPDMSVAGFADIAGDRQVAAEKRFPTLVARPCTPTGGP